jgi:hypothetical protein
MCFSLAFSVLVYIPEFGDGVAVVCSLQRQVQQAANTPEKSVSGAWVNGRRSFVNFWNYLSMLHQSGPSMLKCKKRWSHRIHAIKMGQLH